MKFCRFGLRSGWLRQAFSPSIVYVLREPDAMFRSYWSLGGRRSYFILASLLLVCKNRQSELFREVASALDLPGVDANTVFDELVHVYEASLRYTAQDFRDVLLVLWVLNAVHNMACADLVIDIDLLGTDRHYREVAQAGLSEICGHPLTFDDYRASGVEEAPGACLSDRGIEWARHAVRALGRDAGAWAARASGASESVFAALG